MSRFLIRYPKLERRGGATVGGERKLAARCPVWVVSSGRNHLLVFRMMAAEWRIEVENRWIGSRIKVEVRWFSGRIEAEDLWFISSIEVGYM